MKWVVFDLEFTELLPKIDEPLTKSIHISCASVIATGYTWPQVWYERPIGPITGLSELPSDYMSEKTLEAFIDSLALLVRDSHTIVTWGGSASDWRLLEKECPGKSQQIRQMALESIDIPMCSCISIGMMMGLNAACMALGFSLKETGASENIPELWAQATIDSRLKVLQHVSNDSFATMMVLKHAESTRSLPWISKKGHYKTWTPVQFLSVKACLARELPNVPFKINPEQNAKILARWLVVNHL
jgi:hypothetical protein